MTDTAFAPPPPADPSPSPFPSVRLVRDPHDKVVAGVCAGLGRTTGTDPVLWRVTVAVLAVFGGVGLVLYLLAWLLVPRADAPESLVERVVRGGSIPTAAGVVLALLAVVVLLGITPDSSGPLALLALGGLAVLVVRERRAAGTPLGQPPGAGPVPQPGASLAAAPYAARPPRERSPLGWVTLSLALLVVGVLLLLDEAGLADATPPRVLVAALLVVGGGLLVGTWYGRARWLLLPGVLLALAATGASAAQGPYGWEAGERAWSPTSDVRDFRLGVGRAVLDLREVRAGDRPVRAEVGAGELVVLVPEDLPVDVRTDVEAGEVVLVAPDGSRADAARGRLTDAPGRPVLVDLSVRLGEIEVRRVAA